MSLDTERRRVAEVTDIERLVVELSADLRGYVNAMERAARTTDRQTQTIERRFNQTFSRIERNAVRFGGVLASALSARVILNAADSWTRYENQVRAAGVAQMDVNGVMNDLVGVARRTRSELEGTVNLYARVRRGTEGLALSQAQLLTFVERVNQAFVAGGAASSERAAATLQLSQALASGRLQGDELRSIRENAPLLAQAIADAMGVGIGALRDLGAEGKLTTQVIVDAVLDGTGRIENAFASTQATVADGWAALRTEVAAYIGQINEAVGATDFLARTMQGLANAMGRLRTEGDLDRLSVDELEARIQELESLGAVRFAPVGAAALSPAGNLASQRSAVDAELTRLTAELMARRFGVQARADDGKPAPVTIEGVSVDAANKLTADQERTQALIAELQEDIRLVGNEQAQFIDRFLDRLPDTASESERVEVEQLARAFYEAQQRVAEDERRTEEQERRRRGTALDMISTEAFGGRLLGPGDWGSPVSSDVVNQLLYEAQAMLQRSQLHTLLLHAQQAGRDARRTDNADLAERSALAERLIKQDLHLLQVENQLKELYARDDWRAGAQRALIELSETAGTTADVVEGGIVSAFRGAEAAIEEFVRTGQVSFRELVASIIADLAVLAARSAILGPAASFLGNIFGVPVPAGVLHAGGMAGSGPRRRVSALAFMGAPRLHEGGGWGLRPDEHPAILQTGERVLSRAEAREYGRTPSVNVTIVTPSPEAFRASRTQIAADLGRAVAFGMRAA